MDLNLPAVLVLVTVYLAQFVSTESKFTADTTTEDFVAVAPTQDRNS